MPTPRLTRRRILVATLVALAALVVGLGWLLAADHGRVTRANFELIRFSTRQRTDEGTMVPVGDGMTYEEVVAILGPPLREPWADDLANVAVCVWDGYAGDAGITFERNRAVAGEFFPSSSADRARWLWWQLFRPRAPF
jgi:hypothetical protein